MRLIHGQKLVTAGSPVALAAEPLRVVRLWISADAGGTGSAFLRGPGDDKGAIIGASPMIFDFTAGGRGSVDASTLRVDASSGTRAISYTLLAA